ncbi:hypothetical protein CH373_13180 [Leptospira perolatii]|uniref:Uncharacterized protein n=1 Tax=Leptospira perolatii TaxID=2023191 RepID=A0A2M9ZKR5_9LEPT|nr:hypothetical protein [Leptospira perolatii]PJZ69937.1 hypothetical protein CH360_08505 [Leptospira perolatii]PJZ72655.1 hypothetical protein CH373_13180 [Leptospira perolatii]
MTKSSILAFFIAVILLSGPQVFPQPQGESPKYNAKEFLSKDLDSIFPIIQKMSKKDADILVAQIREEARKSWAGSDHYYFLISHLASISAIEEEQNRLKGLLWVYALGLALFGGFTLYVIYSQRKLIRELNEILKDR